jgi:hypothetical protein
MGLQLISVIRLRYDVVRNARVNHISVSHTQVIGKVRGIACYLEDLANAGGVGVLRSIIHFNKYPQITFAMNHFGNITERQRVGFNGQANWIRWKNKTVDLNSSAPTAFAGGEDVAFGLRVFSREYWLQTGPCLKIRCSR